MKILKIVLGLSFGLCLAASRVVAQSDTEPPTLTSFDFNPKSVDVTGGAATVTCESSAQDALTGVGGVQIAFRSPSGAQYLYCSSRLW